MKTKAICTTLLIVVLASLSQLSAPAQENPIERELQHIQLQLRLENYKLTAMELLQTRKQQALVRNEKEERELVELVERLQVWQEQLTREIHELSEVLHREQPGPDRRREMSNAGRAMPQGHYVLELNFEPQGGKRVVTNIEIRGNEIHCANASDKRFVGMAGRVEPGDGNRVMVRMRNDHHAATQIWERMDDEHWRVLEIPDRGENQVARPVRDERIE